MRMRTSLAVAAVLATAVPLAASRPCAARAVAPQGSGGYHVDARFGYKIRPPKEWQGIPVQVGEGWLIAKFLSDRTYFYTEKGGGWTYDHKPELMVIAFVDEVVKKRGPDVQKEGDVTIVTWKNRYKDYKDYLRNTYAGGGYYVSAEEEMKVGDVAVTALEIKVEKATREGPKRIITWIYHVPDVDVAAQFEVLENSYGKLKTTIERTLKSFKPIERSGELPGEQRSVDGFTFSVSEMDRLSPDDRREKRLAQESALHERAIANLPEGWHHKRYGDFLVLSSADAKFDKRMAEQATAAMMWLDEAFPFVGPQEYVRRPILRICRTQEEESSYGRGGAGGGGWMWFGSNNEIVINKEWDNDLYGIGKVNAEVMDLWFQDRDRDLFWALPAWLRSGLDQLLRNSYGKGGKLEFYPDLWDVGDLRQRVRDGAAARPRDMIQMTSQEFSGRDSQEFWGRRDEANFFVYWMMAGDGARSKDARDMITTYIKNLKLVIEEMAAKEIDVEPEKYEVPKTEQEEEERFRNRQKMWRDDSREKRILQDVFFRTFRSWSDRDWDQLERAYFKSIT